MANKSSKIINGSRLFHSLQEEHRSLQSTSSDGRPVNLKRSFVHKEYPILIKGFNIGHELGA